MEEFATQSVLLQNFSVCNTFEEDDKTKGKFGENDFIKFFNKKLNPKCDKTLFDVSGIQEYRKVDIDFIIDMECGKLLPDIYTVFANPERYKKIEVKYNGPAYKNGKLAFEMISHSGFGWGFITQCDYFYFVLARDYKKDPCDIAKRVWIKRIDWINYIKNTPRNKREKCYLNSGEYGIGNIMTSLDDMEKNGILKYVEY